MWLLNVIIISTVYVTSQSNNNKYSVCDSQRNNNKYSVCDSQRNNNKYSVCDFSK